MPRQRRRLRGERIPPLPQRMPSRPIRACRAGSTRRYPTRQSASSSPSASPVTGFMSQTTASLAGAFRLSISKAAPTGSGRPLSLPWPPRASSRPKAWKVNRIGEHSRRVGRRASLPRWMERSGATLPAPTSKATSGSAGAPMTGMPRVRPEHTYMDVVKFRKENLHRYWCNYSSHGVAGDDPGSARHRIALGDVVIVENQPRFKIQKGATIYTIGSCFARNVERSLKRQGFRVPTAEIEIDKEIYVGHTVFHNTVLNKYNAHSMATEILRGLEASPDPGLLEVAPGQGYGPQTSITTFKPGK